MVRLGLAGEGLAHWMGFRSTFGLTLGMIRPMTLLGDYFTNPDAPAFTTARDLPRGEAMLPPAHAVRDWQGI